MNAGIAHTHRRGLSRDTTRSNDAANAPRLARKRVFGSRVRATHRALRVTVGALLALCIGNAVAQQSAVLDDRVTQQSIGQTICRPGYAETVAPPFDDLIAHKDRMLAARGIDPDDGAAFALDRRVPIVLGGSPDAPANLDLLPWAGPQGERRKARAAAMLKRCVCEGKLSLAQAQAAIVGNWSAVYAGFGQASCDVNRLDVATGDVDGDSEDSLRGDTHERERAR
ncbi:hypothetical protein BJG93_17495 [Paraburkholderia sprentiae WSM5005]|uniref:Uncharacterized protein n=1 Tax=Paraburkholderia sprentiae WSM5005 TaxID=754502 RepID=A0A1I9YLY3_9BURK|nr:hypothetical protein [Paraburkholderia sprentiae]APA87316.1 hypothetical protein BJG93_17495 [Paraburkholderia sprentiae WSM5005]